MLRLQGYSCQNAMQQQQAMQANQELVKQAGSIASSPLMDPSKNPNAEDNAAGMMQQLQQ